MKNNNFVIDENTQEVEKIHLFVSGRELKDMDLVQKSSPQVVFYTKNNLKNSWQEYQRTEIIQKQLNPTFIKEIAFDFTFEKKQEIKIDVIDIEDPSNLSECHFIGSAETTLGQIVGSLNSTIAIPIQDRKGQRTGKIILRAQRVVQCMDHLVMKWTAKEVKDTSFFTKTDPFLKFYKIHENQEDLLVHQTEVQKNNLNPRFDEISIGLGKIANGDPYAPILVELWDNNLSGSHTLLGSFRFSANNIAREGICDYIAKDKDGNCVGKFHAYNSIIDERPSFLDFIAHGTQLDLIAAIDFTASNGDPDMPQSLHQIKQGELNCYQIALQQVGEILLHYDHDKLVPMYGFGAKPLDPNLNPQNKVLHCFPLNGNPEKPDVFGMKGIMDGYRNSLNNVHFSGPTLFAPLLRETLQLARDAQIEQKEDPSDDCYQILLILTDGEIFDMDDTIRCIIEAARLPLSIIIIGIGNEDFKNMEILDGDNGLVDQYGNKAERDLVQFVPFNEFKDNPTLLAQQVLEELPKQLEEYMKLVKRRPESSKKVLPADDIQSFATDFQNGMNFENNQNFKQNNEGIKRPSFKTEQQQFPDYFSGDQQNQQNQFQQQQFYQQQRPQNAQNPYASQQQQSQQQYQQQQSQFQQQNSKNNIQVSQNNQFAQSQYSYQEPQFQQNQNQNPNPYAYPQQQQQQYPQQQQSNNNIQQSNNRVQNQNNNPNLAVSYKNPFLNQTGQLQQSQLQQNNGNNQQQQRSQQRGQQY